MAGSINLRREVLTTEWLDPTSDFQPVQRRVEVRWDPLTGHASRILSDVQLFKTSAFDLRALAEQTRPECPFCGERIETATPRLPSAIHPEGRIHRGTAVLFPNLVTYAQYSAVAVYGPDLHFLSLDQMTPRLVADNLAVQVEFITRVMKHDPQARWASINANQMLPSGGSLFHPHMQAAVDRFPSTMQQRLSQVAAERFAEFLELEQREGERYIGRTGNVHWLASFAPIGFEEIMAYIPEISSPVALSSSHVEGLGIGLSRVLNLYAEMGHQSYNLACYGLLPGTGTPLMLRIVARSNPDTLYRSDAMYSERLHWQAMVDTSPEELATRARASFDSSRSGRDR